MSDHRRRLASREGPPATEKAIKMSENASQTALPSKKRNKRKKKKAGKGEGEGAGNGGHPEATDKLPKVRLGPT